MVNIFSTVQGRKINIKAIIKKDFILKCNKIKDNPVFLKCLLRIGSTFIGTCLFCVLKRVRKILTIPLETACISRHTEINCFNINKIILFYLIYKGNCTKKKQVT